MTETEFEIIYLALVKYKNKEGTKIFSKLMKLLKKQIF